MSSWCWKPSQNPPWPHHPTIVCDVSLSSPDQYLATHWPLTLAQPDFSACVIVFSSLFFVVVYRNVTGGRERSNKSMWKTYLCWIHLRDISCLVLFFFANVLKTCGIYLFFNLALFIFFFYVAFFLPLSVKFTWKLNTGIGTRLCYLVPLAICWLLWEKNKTNTTHTLESLTCKRRLSALLTISAFFAGSVKIYMEVSKQGFLFINGKKTKIPCVSTFSFLSLFFELSMAQWKVHLLCLEKWLPTWVNFFRTDSQIDNLWFKCTLRLPIFYTIESIED